MICRALRTSCSIGHLDLLLLGFSRRPSAAETSRQPRPCGSERQRDIHSHKRGGEMAAGQRVQRLPVPADQDRRNRAAAEADRTERRNTRLRVESVLI